MKIALVGSHGVGKTTICHELVAELKKKGRNAGLLEEVVRLCPLAVNEEATQDSQKWILFTQLAKELELTHRYDILVCDRSVLDDYAYYFNKFDKSEMLEHVVMEHLKTYDFLFKVPLRDWLNKDGFRSVDKEFQKQIDGKMDFLLKRFEQKYFNYTSVTDVIGLIEKY